MSAISAEELVDVVVRRSRRACATRRAACPRRRPRGPAGRRRRSRQPARRQQRPDPRALRAVGGPACPRPAPSARSAGRARLTDLDGRVALAGDATSTWSWTLRTLPSGWRASARRADGLDAAVEHADRSASGAGRARAAPRSSRAGSRTRRRGHQRDVDVRPERRRVHRARVADRRPGVTAGAASASRSRGRRAVGGLAAPAPATEDDGRTAYDDGKNRRRVVMSWVEPRHHTPADRTPRPVSAVIWRSKTAGAVYPERNAHAPCRLRLGGPTLGRRAPCMLRFCARWTIGWRTRR